MHPETWNMAPHIGSKVFRIAFTMSTLSEDRRAATRRDARARAESVTGRVP